MDSISKVPRESVECVEDLETMRELQLNLINLQLYDKKLTPRHLNKIVFEIHMIEIWIKENSARILKSEFKVKPITSFPRLCDTPEES